jgi:hypothetical protein
VFAFVWKSVDAEEDNAGPVQNGGEKDTEPTRPFYPFGSSKQPQVENKYGHLGSPGSEWVENAQDGIAYQPGRGNGTERDVPCVLSSGSRWFSVNRANYWKKKEFMTYKPYR